MLKKVLVCLGPSGGCYTYQVCINVRLTLFGAKSLIEETVWTLYGERLPRKFISFSWNGTPVDSKPNGLSSLISDLVDFSEEESPGLVVCYNEDCWDHFRVNLESSITNLHAEKGLLFSHSSHFQKSAKSICSRIQSEKESTEYYIKETEECRIEEFYTLEAKFQRDRAEINKKYSTILKELEEKKKSLNQVLCEVTKSKREANSMKQITSELDLECPVMKHLMLPPTRIFQCSRGHIFCEDCFGRDQERRRLTSCPICREDFSINPPQRNLFAERVAALI